MKVFVAGATGMVGRPALAALVADGHDVTAVARSPEKAALIRSVGATPINVDLFDANAVRGAVAGYDVVINLATHIPPLTKMMLSNAWDENTRIRTEVSKNLVDAAIATGAQQYIQESIAFIYRDGGDAWLDEDGHVDVAPYASSTLTAEENARRFAESGGTAVILRFGMFHGAQSDQTQSQIRAARAGMAMLPGASDAYVPFIHTDDAGRAVAAALRAPSGTYNIVDNEPLTRRGYADAVGAAVGKRKVRVAPSAMTKLGGSKTEMLARSQRVSNRRFRHATGWTPKYPSAREAFAAIVRELPEPQHAAAARLLLAIIALVSLQLAVWATLWPHNFYANFPGGGRHWVSVDGPYNEHFIRDFGGLNLAMAILTGWAALRYTRALARLASVAYLGFAIPHFIYHANHLAPLSTTGDKVSNMVTLGLGLVAPVLVLVLSRNRPHGGELVMIDRDMRGQSSQERVAVSAR